MGTERNMLKPKFQRVRVGMTIGYISVSFVSIVSFGLLNLN